MCLKNYRMHIHDDIIKTHAKLQQYSLSVQITLFQPDVGHGHSRVPAMTPVIKSDGVSGSANGMFF